MGLDLFPIGSMLMVLCALTWFSFLFLFVLPPAWVGTDTFCDLLELRLKLLT